jgi:hypothetical protein
LETGQTSSSSAAFRGANIEPPGFDPTRDHAAALINEALTLLPGDPGRIPVFGEDHAPTRSWNGMTTARDVILSGKIIAADTGKWSKVIRAANIKLV